MAIFVGMFGTPHYPGYHRLTSQPRSEWSVDTANMFQRGELMRQKLRRAEPDSLLLVGNDHFHQFFMDIMPAFVIGKMPVFDGTFWNEVRDFELPTLRVPGDVDLAHQLLVGSLRRGVDFAYSNEMKIDHSLVVPLLMTRPELDLPIVPILTNVTAPPLAPAERFLQVGRVIRAVIDDLPGDRRIAVIVSGNLSLDVGGPLQTVPHAMDPQWDQRAIDWIASGDVDAAIRACTYEDMLAVGNLTHAFVNFVLAMGIAGDLRPSYAEPMWQKGWTQPWIAWEPTQNGATASAESAA